MNWALIGYGGMGGWHVGKVRTLEDFTICGVYDINSERSAAARADGLTAYDTLEALLGDEKVELVTVATPNDTHLPLVTAALRAGKHVICEKPVALSSDELQEMVDTAKETGRLFTVHQNRRWDEDYLTVQNIYRAQELGRVFNIESRVHGSRGVPGDWRNRKRQGGGMILDWGVHLLDQLLMMVEEDVISTYCTVSHVTNDEVDDGFKAIITFASGLTAHVEVGTSCFANLPRWYMQGENGSVVVEDWDINGRIVKVSDWEKRDAVPVVTAAGLTKTMAPRTEETIATYPVPRVESDVRDFYRNVKSAAEGKGSQLITHDQVMRVMKLMEAMLASAERNEVIHSRI